MAVARTDRMRGQGAAKLGPWEPQVEWNGQIADVFAHPYNLTAINELGAQLAVLDMWRSRDVADESIVEFGDVTSSYDQLEHHGHVLHRSTDAPPVDADTLEVFAVGGRGLTVDDIVFLTGLLDRGARALITVPTGTTSLDRWLAGSSGATRACTLVRDMDGWRTTPGLEFRPYGRTQGFAEAVWVGEWER